MNLPDVFSTQCRIFASCLVATVIVSASAASAAPLQLSAWKVSPFSQVDARQDGEAVVLTRDVNPRSNPPGIRKAWRFDRTDAPADLSLSVSLDSDSVFIFRILTAAGPLRVFDGQEWRPVTIKPFSSFFQTHPRRDASLSPHFLNLATHTVRLANAGDSQEVRVSVPPLPGIADYRIELFNAGAGGTLRIHDLSVKQPPRESDPGDFAMLRESVGRPDFPSKDGAARKVIVHVVPWYPPNAAKLPVKYDPEQTHLTLAANEPDEVKRVESHLLAIQKAGIDVVALDVQVRNGWTSRSDPKTVIWQARQPLIWLDAMKRLAPKMRFCLQLDRGGGEPISVEVWSAAVKALEEVYSGHPNYYRIHEQPVLLSFWLNQKVPDSVLRAIREKADSDFYFVGSIVENPENILGPLIRSVINPRRVEEAIDIFDAIEICPLGSHLSWLDNIGKFLAPRLREADKPLFWGVSTGYYRKGVAFIEPAYYYLHSLWMFALRENADHVILWTWNDVAEDHDILPSSLKGTALLDLMSLYSAWYKSGQFPELKKDRIFISWPVNNGGRRSPGGGEHPTWPNLNYYAWMTAPGDLHIPGIGRVHLKAGLNVGQLGKCVPGYPSEYRLTRAGDEVFHGDIVRPMQNSPTGAPENMKYNWEELDGVPTK